MTSSREKKIIGIIDILFIIGASLLAISSVLDIEFSLFSNIRLLYAFAIIPVISSILKHFLVRSQMRKNNLRILMKSNEFVSKSALVVFGLSNFFYLHNIWNKSFDLLQLIFLVMILCSALIKEKGIYEGDGFILLDGKAIKFNEIDSIEESETYDLVIRVGVEKHMICYYSEKKYNYMKKYLGEKMQVSKNAIISVS